MKFIAIFLVLTNALFAQSYILCKKKAKIRGFYLTQGKTKIKFKRKSKTA